MENLNKKLKNLENQILEERNYKKEKREKFEKKQFSIHQKFIKIWNEKLSKNKKFKSDLDKILSSFKKINPKNNQYYWMLEEDISVKERVKNIVSFILNEQKISLELRLYGSSSEIYLHEDDTYKIENIEKAKDNFINEVLEIFQDQNKN
ncbi:hypothetical protein OAD05_00840 [Candidatus Pelagibacter sp.]|nr:hypothetical protein [Candidatus Pelagibacter sp.]|tara:strand:+ start:12 stop:461 length:450 start_codon:yes stop_codon:yes gene_type:complete